MRRKKLVPAVALAAAALLALSACNSPTEDSAGEQDITALPDSDIETTLNIWGYAPPEFAGWIEEGKALLAEEFPNVTVEYTFVPFDQIAPKVLGTAATGDSPDGIVYNPADAAQLAQAGVLLDLTPFWENYADSAQYPDSVVWQSGDAITSVQGYVNTTALFYNQDILDEVGIAPPTTIEELDRALEAVAAAGYNGLAMSAVPTPESEFQLLPWLFGEGQNYGDFDADVVEQVLDRFVGWIDSGYIPQDAVSWTQADAFDRFSAGDFAFTQNGNWQLGAARELPFEWGVVPLPAGTAGSFSVGGGEGVSIGAEAKNPALGWRFFELALLSQESQVKILDSLGNIPARADAADSEVIQSDPILAVFADVVASNKARPSSVDMANLSLEVGKLWNAVAGGQVTAAEAAERFQAEFNTFE